MEMIPVGKSSSVAAVGFDGFDKITVEYRNGRQYVYSGATQNMWQTLMEANDPEVGNVGKVVANAVKTLPYKEVERTLPRMPEEPNASQE